jgi:ABC-type Fe3+/spermidine/putrescine transport system ATPase subunit
VVRPERLVLDHRGLDGFAGTVSQEVFVGNDTLYLVHAGGHELTVRRQNDEHAGERFREGDRVAVSVRRAWALPTSAEPA